MLTFAQSTRSVNGVRGEKVPSSAEPMTAPDGPKFTFKTSAGGGGLAHDHDHEGEPA